MDRKKFLKLGTFAFAGIQSHSLLTTAEMPLVVATWESGLKVNSAAWKWLETGGRALDAVEAGARFIEDTIDCCVGLGGFPDRDGIVTLDACIMDENANCGAVAGLEQIKHPISVARKIMETTPHVLLVGQGAQQFALENGFSKEKPELSGDAASAYKKWLKKSKYEPVINIENKKQNGPFAPHFFEDGSLNHDTMGLLAIDLKGNLSGAVTTSGMAFKLHGRAGDSPIIGAGLFVDNEYGAATSSGMGEEVIRICGTHLVVEFLRQRLSPEMACKKAVERIVKRDPKKAKELQVGFLAINKQGVHGAFAIQPGFVYAVHNSKENKLFRAPSYF